MSGEAAWDPTFAGRSPVFAPLSVAAAHLRTKSDWPEAGELNSLINGNALRHANALGLPIRFIPQGSAEVGRDYELGVYRTGCVPTRPRNWHDLLNALVWVTFPAAKAALNARHAEARKTRLAGTNRGAVEDALTGFDESGIAVACADPVLARLLLDFRWKELFWVRRQEVLARMRFTVFGHGLYEKALRPFVGMTGKGILVPVHDGFFARPLDEQTQELDQALAALIRSPESLASPRELAPIPLLGVPGWWAPNQDPDFYDDSGYFRSGRRGARP
jgi:hypothetical protein